jgi:hypothetical protein
MEPPSSGAEEFPASMTAIRALNHGAASHIRTIATRIRVMQTIMVRLMTLPVALFLGMDILDSKFFWITIDYAELLPHITHSFTSIICNVPRSQYLREKARNSATSNYSIRFLRTIAGLVLSGGLMC